MILAIGEALCSTIGILCGGSLIGFGLIAHREAEEQKMENLSYYKKSKILKVCLKIILLLPLEIALCYAFPILIIPIILIKGIKLIFKRADKKVEGD